MRERIVAFDYLRALAITGILLCHFCHNYNSISFLGHYFGGVFVTLFIAMSGMLFGIVWNNNSRMEYDMSFLKQRFFKLSVTYYPFFISFEIYLMFELVSEGRYSLMRIIDNPFFAFVVYVISSVLLGCILHFIVKYIKNMCFNCS
mgnify:CR=1 FL=1